MSAFRAFNSRWFNAAAYNAGPVEETQADSVTPSDSVALDISLVLSDSVTATDSLAHEISLATADTVSTTDSEAADVGLDLSDLAPLSDAVTAGGDLVLGDSVTVTEGLVAELGLTESLSDSVTVTDGITTQLTPGTPTTPEGGWVRTRRIAIPRRHSLVLADIVLTSDDYELELKHPPPVAYKESVADRVYLADTIDIEHDNSATRREEEELVLALI